MKKKYFTLLELVLVTIAAISLLCGTCQILRMAVLQNNILTCADQQRKLGQCIVKFSADADNWLLPRNTDAAYIPFKSRDYTPLNQKLIGNRWFETLSKLYPEVVKSPFSCVRCPAYTGPKNYLSTKAEPVKSGGNIGYNGATGIYENKNFYHKMNQLPSPSKTLCTSDCWNSVNGNADYIVTGKTGRYNQVHFRHQGKTANIGFYDGHVENITAEKLPENPTAGAASAAKTFWGRKTLQIP